MRRLGGELGGELLELVLRRVRCERGGQSRDGQRYGGERERERHARRHGVAVSGASALRARCCDVDGVARAQTQRCVESGE